MYMLGITELLIIALIAAVPMSILGAVVWESFRKTGRKTAKQSVGAEQRLDEE